jgi:predicted nuclease with RNAse H fold
VPLLHPGNAKRYVGIDVALRRFDVAVLDRDRRIHALPEAFGEIDSLVAWLCEHAPESHIAIDAPQRTREGLLADDEQRQALSTPPPPGRYRTSRVCDYELMRRGLPLYPVPAEYGACPEWMRVGFRLFSALLRAGPWTLFDGTRQRCCLLEVYPFSVFAVALGAIPPRKSTPAGREARVHALATRLATGAAIEAATHHHALDALAAAYTAWAFDHGVATWVGDPREGLMVVPGQLLPSYRARAG